VVEYQIAELLLVPPILIRMVRDPIVDEYDLSHLMRFSSGAAPLSEEIIQQLKDKFPNTGFKQGEKASLPFVYQVTDKRSRLRNVRKRLPSSIHLPGY